MSPYTNTGWMMVSMKPSIRDEINKGTSVPLTIKRIHRQHFDSVYNILMWLHNIGCKTRYTYYIEEVRVSLSKELRKRLSHNICLQINISGLTPADRGTPDLEGNSLLIRTLFEVEVEYPTTIMESVLDNLRALPTFSGINNVRLEDFSYHGFKGKWNSINKRLVSDLKFSIFHRGR